MRTLVPCLVLLALCAACGKPEAPPAIEPPSVTFSDMDAGPKAGSVGQWLDADGAGEIGLVYRLQAQVVDFTLSCRQSDKSLTVKAAYSGPAPTVGEIANVQLGATLTDAKVVDEPGLSGPGAVAVRAPVTADLLGALVQARAVGLTYRGAFTGTGEEEGDGKLRGFAQNCARLVGMDLPR